MVGDGRVDIESCIERRNRQVLRRTATVTISAPLASIARPVSSRSLRQPNDQRRNQNVRRRSSSRCRRLRLIRPCSASTDEVHDLQRIAARQPGFGVARSGDDLLIPLHGDLLGIKAQHDQQASDGQRAVGRAFERRLSPFKVNVTELCMTIRMVRRPRVGNVWPGKAGLRRPTRDAAANVNRGRRAIRLTRNRIIARFARLNSTPAPNAGRYDRNVSNSLPPNRCSSRCHA